MQALKFSYTHISGAPAGAWGALGKQTRMGHFNMLGPSFMEEHSKDEDMQWGGRLPGNSTAEAMTQSRALSTPQPTGDSR